MDLFGFKVSHSYIVLYFSIAYKRPDLSAQDSGICASPGVCWCYYTFPIWAYFDGLQPLEMKPRTNGGSRSQRSKGVQSEGPNWVIIAGSALLSTLSVRLGYKLKQVLDSRQQNKTTSSLKGPTLFKAVCFVLWTCFTLLDMRSGLNCRKREVSW